MQSWSKHSKDMASETEQGKAWKRTLKVYWFVLLSSASVRLYDMCRVRSWILFWALNDRCHFVSSHPKNIILFNIKTGMQINGKYGVPNVRVFAYTLYQCTNHSLTHIQYTHAVHINVHIIRYDRSENNLIMYNNVIYNIVMHIHLHISNNFLMKTERLLEIIQFLDDLFYDIAWIHHHAASFTNGPCHSQTCIF